MNVRQVTYLQVKFVIVTERQKRMTVSGADSGGEQRKDEEEWLLRDVIFVEDVRCVPAGRVLKVDGAYAAVRFHLHIPKIVMQRKQMIFYKIVD